MIAMVKKILSATVSNTCKEPSIISVLNMSTTTSLRIYSYFVIGDSAVIDVYKSFNPELSIWYTRLYRYVERARVENIKKWLNYDGHKNNNLFNEITKQSNRGLNIIKKIFINDNLYYMSHPALMGNFVKKNFFEMLLEKGIHVIPQDTVKGASNDEYENIGMLYLLYLYLMNEAILYKNGYNIIIPPDYIRH